MKLCFLTVFVLLLQLEIFMVVSANIKPLKPIKTSPTYKPQILPNTSPTQETLSFTYYLNTCPGVEGIIQQKVNAWVQQDYTLAASIIRLHFHDCAVRGCDGSILLDYPGSERRAFVSRTLRGFQVIDDIKREIEKICPKTVSCADILTTAARDATVLVGGPFWEVPFGRKDGRISIAREADMLPQGHEDVTTLINFFETLGLNILDLVTLSGSHTIGRSTCYSILNRLAYFNGTRKHDPSLDTKYWDTLRKQCTRSYYYVDLDVETPRTFDTLYYTNLQNKKGLLSTDQSLYLDERTKPFVETMASESQLFTDQFATSMVNLGNVQDRTSNNGGEIRLNCNYVNP